VISFMSEFGVNNLDKAVLMENLNNELKSDPEFASEFMAERDARQKCIKDVIRLGIRQGVMKKDLDADMAGAILFAMVSGMYQHWAVNRARIDGEQFVRMARRIFMEGVKS
ncbi:MAG: hypothetical protein JW950_11940, partial [Deltaproteobacteria bacterium]|nr:hypothetical protein [Deltaproteobacteria bacterium]